MDIVKKDSKIISESKSSNNPGIHADSTVYLQIKDLLGIPEDEPIFILRAQDKFAVRTIKLYKSMARDGFKQRPKTFDDWLVDISEIIGAFVRWGNNNKDRIKVPD